MVQKLGETAQEGGKNNIAFIANFLIGNLETCLEILIASNRLPEAAFFARLVINNTEAMMMKKTF